LPTQLRGMAALDGAIRGVSSRSQKRFDAAADTEDKRLGCRQAAVAAAWAMIVGWMQIIGQLTARTNSYALGDLCDSAHRS